MTYGDIKDLNRRTAADKVLCDKAFDVAKNPKHDDISVDLLQWSIRFSIKKPLVVELKWEYLKQRISWKITQSSY